MDPSIEELISDMNFDLEPMFIIKLDDETKSDWYLKEMEFEIHDDIFTRKMYWTPISKEALRFYSLIDVHDFVVDHMAPTKASIVEIKE